MAAVQQPIDPTVACKDQHNYDNHRSLAHENQFLLFSSHQGQPHARPFDQVVIDHASRGWSVVRNRLPFILQLRRDEDGGRRALFEGKEFSESAMWSGIVKPGGRLAGTLKSSRALCLAAMLFIIPYQFAFESADDFSFSRFSDLLFIVDIHNLLRLVLISTVVPVADSAGKLVVDSKAIFREFISNKLRLVYHLVVLFPFYLFGFDWAMVRLIGLLELGELKDLIRLLLTAVFRIFPYTERYREKKLLAIDLMNAVAVLYIIAHVLACLWIRVNRFDHRDLPTTYVNALYFLMTTASTVGYGDLTVDHVSESGTIGRYLFAMVIIVIGLNYFAYLQSVISVIAFDWRLNFQRHSNLIGKSLQEWMAARNKLSAAGIPVSLEVKINRYFTSIQNIFATSDLKTNRFVNLMRPSHRQQVEDCLTFDIRQAFSIFTWLSVADAVDLCCSCSVVNFEEGEVIDMADESRWGVYLLARGEVEVSLGDDCIRRLLPTSQFGHRGWQDVGYRFTSRRLTTCYFISHESIGRLLIRESLVFDRLMTALIDGRLPIDGLGRPAIDDRSKVKANRSKSTIQSIRQWLRSAFTTHHQLIIGRSKAPDSRLVLVDGSIESEAIGQPPPPNSPRSPLRLLKPLADAEQSPTTFANLPAIATDDQEAMADLTAPIDSFADTDTIDDSRIADDTVFSVTEDIDDVGRLLRTISAKLEFVGCKFDAVKRRLIADLPSLLSPLSTIDR